MNCDIREHFETVVIKDKIWFVCKYGDCDDCEVTEEDIVSHIKDHLKSEKSGSNGGVDTSQTFAQFSNESIPDIKPTIEIIPVPIDLSRGDPQEEIEPYYCPPKSFKCHIPGCRKTFLYMKSLMLHRNDHKMKAKPLKNVVNPQNNGPINVPKSPQPIPLPKVVPKSNCNQSAAFNTLSIKEKYLRVQRLNDRSIHRWQKQDHRSDANYKGMQSLKNLNQYYRKDIIGNEKYYLCQYNQSCTFKTSRSQHMARHLNCCHFRTRIFRCNVRGCDRKYYNPTSLRQHTLNHKCGFGILNGKTMTTLCGNKSINRFRKRIIEGEPPLKIFKCDFLDCPFKTKSHTCIKRHIHDQHLCPNRVKYLDEELVSHLIPKDTNTQNQEMSENIGIASNIMIPQMIALPQISRYSHKKKSRERNGLQIIPIPEIREMPQISGDTETMEIPVTPEMIDIRDMPILVPQIKKELIEEVSQKNYNVHQEIDRLIEGDGSPQKLNLNPNQINSVKEEEEDSNGSDDEIQIVDEIIGQQRTVSPEFRQLIEVKNLTLDYSNKTFEKGRNELEKLNICRPHFERKMDDNVGLRFVCRCCKFPAKSLEAISTHLRLKHFIEN